MHKSLEDYLAQIEKALRPLPAARRREEMEEMRQHLLSAVAVNQEKGQSEDLAVADALRQFGGHQELGTKVVSAWRRERWRRLGEAPELTAFAVFASVITVSSLWLTFFGPMQWRETAEPYTGASFFGPYINSLYFAWTTILAPDRVPKSHISRRAFISAPVVMLLLYAAFGAGEYWWLIRLPAFHNPYLSVNPWRPVWTVALPLAWALVIYGGQARREHKNRQQAS